MKNLINLVEKYAMFILVICAVLVTISQIKSAFTQVTSHTILEVING